jgi:hypothetical protein
MLAYTFSFPQLATALTGSILAYTAYPLLKKSLTKTEHEKPANAK